MRIGIVSNAFPRFGDDYYGVFVWELAHFLQERGHEVHVVTGRRAGTEQESEYRGVPVRRFSYLGWKEDHRPAELGSRPWRLGSMVLAGVWTMADEVRRWQLDVIHAYWLLHAGLIGWLAGRWTGRPVVATAPGRDLNVLPAHRVLRAMLRCLLPRLDGLICEGSALRDTALRLGARPQTTHVILGDGGIDGRLFAPRSPALDGRREKRLLFVGGLTPPKRLDTLLQAMAEVVRVCPETQLRIVGDGEDRPRWEALAGDLGITGQVTFAGALPHEDIPAEMRSASVLVHCSDHEGLPSAIMEALMCGLPVVATRVGGIPDLIQDGGTGFLVDPERPDETAERLVTILSNPDLIARMSRAALAFARAHLDKEIVMDQIEELYRTVL